MIKLKPDNEKQKQKYAPASIEIVRFLSQDILTTSGGLDPGYDPGIDLPIDPFET